jgi:hypothetical protein
MPGHAEWPKAIAEAVAGLRADNPTCGERERAVPLEREGSVVSPPPSGACFAYSYDGCCTNRA